MNLESENPVTVNIIVPPLGNDSTPAKITQWVVEVGDPVKKFAPVVQVETDKATFEIAAPASGILVELVVPEGARVTAGTVLGHIRKSLDADADASSEHPRKSVGITIGLLGLLCLLGLIVIGALYVLFVRGSF